MGTCAEVLILLTVREGSSKNHATLFVPNQVPFPAVLLEAQWLPTISEVGTWKLIWLGELASCQEGSTSQGMVGICLGGKHKSFIVFFLKFFFSSS